MANELMTVSQWIHSLILWHVASSPQLMQTMTTW